MAARRETRKTAQAWIDLISEDPEALSAFEVARTRMTAGRHLQRLRRIRIIELTGKLPTRARLEGLLHGSTQFYNPHKERCVVRLATTDVAPLAAGERAVLVIERDAERRPAAERWWRHETGEAVEVREGTAWALTFASSDDAGDAIEDLTLVRGRRQGLLCNPHSQECRVAGERVPLPWLDAPLVEKPKPARRKTATASRSKK